MDGFQVLDWQETEIVVGSKVVCAAAEPEEMYVAIVTAISEPDGDYDDELQRGVEYPPKVTITFEDGETDEMHTHNITPMAPEISEMIYQADDLQVCK